MALKLAGRNPAKFEFNDGVSETIVTIQPADDPDTVRAKLQRVLELEGAPTPDRALFSYSGQPQAPAFTPADRAATDARLASVQTSGWNEDAMGGLEDLPEAAR